MAPGSTAVTFKPKRALRLLGASTSGETIVLRAATAAASTSLMLQAVLPFLLFGGVFGMGKAGKEGKEGKEGSKGSGQVVEAAPLTVDLVGGTHVSFAPTFDYLDQVLFPTLEAWFGVRVGRTLERRGW